MTLEVSHAPMSSLKASAAGLQAPKRSCAAQNRYDMSVTAPVSHVETWPYVAMAAARFESQRSTAVRMVASSMGSEQRRGELLGHGRATRR